MHKGKPLQFQERLNNLQTIGVTRTFTAKQHRCFKREEYISHDSPVLIAITTICVFLPAAKSKQK